MLVHCISIGKYRELCFHACTLYKYFEIEKDICFMLVHCISTWKYRELYFHAPTLYKYLETKRAIFSCSHTVKVFGNILYEGI